MNILVYEDKQVQLLHPVTTGRAAYAIQCGGCRLVDWLKRLGGQLCGMVRSHLRTLQMLDFPEFGALDPNQPWTLLVNARLAPTVQTFEHLRLMIQAPATKVARVSGTIVAAVVPTSQLGSQTLNLGHSPGDWQQSELDRLESYFAEFSAEMLDVPLELIEYPHDIIRIHLASFNQNLQYLISEWGFEQRQDGFFVGADVQLPEHLVVDTRPGPVVIDRNVSVGPYSYLRGPVYIGPNSRIIEHSSLKDNVCIVHTGKIGGEVEASIIDAFTNKQHHGFLGHSILGSWINLGAGTCNSDLKNTYGEVKMEYSGKRVATGMQFIGCIVGDYAKSAINTGIFTGKVVGTCSMLYGFVTTNVPSFVNYARSFGQITEMPPAVMVSTQKRMFQRRNVQQRTCDIQLINDMYELTRHERQIAEEPLAL
ncbi:MAG TPA: putative sugar nucleotidyl transferase [Pirellulaceae bacterium]|nr:putative sugar nucleotidyl transferase [Pirellulaceae bacterium]HMO92493.1 putative sugar nucleotidyl transferase [Pirellulaceae bacterium]HMP69024.1 putative sugar nucleotidyl transferase [Pirellulaceae bacterium]